MLTFATAKLGEKAGATFCASSALVQSLVSVDEEARRAKAEECAETVLRLVRLRYGNANGGGSGNPSSGHGCCSICR